MRTSTHSELVQLRELVGTLRAALEASQKENVLLRQKVDALVRQIFGASSERIDPAQLELLLQLPAAPTPAVVDSSSAPSTRPAYPRRQRTAGLPEDLPVVEEVLDPEPVQQQPAAWRCIGQETSEQLDYEPGRFLLRRLIRRKYVHRTQRDHAPLIAPLPPRLADRSLPAPGLLAHVLVSKYCDHRVPRATGRTMNSVCLRNCMTDEGSKAPRDRLTGAGLKSPLAAVDKTHGRERRRKRPGLRDRVRWVTER